MTVFQVAAVLFALFMIYVVSIHYKKYALSELEVSFWYSTWVVFIVIAVFPDLLREVAGILHFSRVFDLLVVAALMMLTILIFLSYFAQKVAMQKLETFVRNDAILVAVKSNSKVTSLKTKPRRRKV